MCFIFIIIFVLKPFMLFQIYVLQYPLRPYWRPYELGERCDEVCTAHLLQSCSSSWRETNLFKSILFVLQVRVKPASAEVEVDLSIDVDSKNYDPDAPNAQRMKKQVIFFIRFEIFHFSIWSIYLN